MLIAIVSTMSKIEILPDQVIDQIAAGEVVEDPATLLKELLENAVDAKATKITVRLQDGGFTYLSVEDNGTGMDRENAIKAIKRHATSKLSTVEDLSCLATMGFRGEALASIAAVSKMELLTSNKEMEGVLLKVEGGKIVEEKEAARVQGTTITVRALFANIPARMRFQKSPASSLTKIIRLLSAFSFVHTDIQFLLFQKKEMLFSAYPYPEKCEKEKMALRIREILGKESFEKMIPIEHKKGDYKVEGFTSSAGCGRKNRLGQYLFINKRWVFSPFLSKQIKEIYGTTLNKEEHPLFILSLTIPPHAVDVNVHPQKREIRFQDNLFIASLIEESLRKKLLPQGISIAPSPYMQKFPWEDSSAPLEKEEKEELFKPPISSEQPNLFMPSKKIVGKIGKFILIEEESRFFITTFYALHEKLTERLFTCSWSKPPLQKLLFPITLSLSREEMAKAYEKKAKLSQMGLFATWKDNSISFSHIPVWMDEEGFRAAFFQFLEGKKKKKNIIPNLSLQQWEALLPFFPEEDCREIGEKECMMLWEKIVR